ncbi:hypothetical protein CK203_074652 [Vitis vinifera]|uniref:Uncharacterized protein n=1 Tax=Vitis vinifera TaxID=29760 RepID=A0A438DWC5_VITVI|nr:hypothetical protein CK203_074652 [Vitis vinifera]
MSDSGTLGASKQAFDYGGSMSVGIVSSEAGMIDRASMVIDNLVKRKPLPQKGGLLKAVTEAAIPIPIEEGAAGFVDQKSIVSLNCTSSTSYLEISHGYFQNSSSSMSSSAHGSGSFLNRGCPSSDGTDSDFMQNHIPAGKRRRL